MKIMKVEDGNGAADKDNDGERIQNAKKVW